MKNIHQIRKCSFLILCLVHFQLVKAQNPKDTIKIGEVNVVAKKKLEEAGIEKIRIDTLVLRENVSNSLSEILSENTPVFVKNSGRGSLSSVSFRGTAASHTDLIWNGLSIKDPMLGQVDFSLIPVFLVDEMSLSAGGNSIKEGSGALGGSILINNKVDWQNTFSGRALLSVGSFSTFNEFFEISVGKVNKFQSKTRIFHSFSANDYKFTNTNNADIDPTTGEYIFPMDKNNGKYKLYGFLQEFYFRASANDITSMKFWSQWSDRVIPTVNTFEGDEHSNKNQQLDQTHRLALDWKHYFGNPKLSLSVKSSLGLKKMNYRIENLINSTEYQKFVDSYSNSLSNVSQLAFKYSFSENSEINFDYNFSFYSVKNEELVKQTVYDKTRSEHSLFFSYHQKIGEKFSSSVMVRKEYVDEIFLDLIPSISFEYMLWQKYDFKFRAMLSRNYKQPSLNDLFWQPGGNPNLKPEEGVLSEMGLQLTKEFICVQLNPSITAFYNNIENWIIWIPSVQGYWHPENIQTVKSFGFESNLKLNFVKNKFKLSVNLAYAFTRSLNYGDKEIWGEESYGKQLVYIPVHSGNANVSAFYKGFYLTYSHNSYSERFVTSTNDVSKRNWLYPYFMNNLFLGKKIKFSNNELDVNFKIYNLFNEHYRTVLDRIMPGINFLMLASFKF